MKHRISSGGIVVVDGCVLLVRHFVENSYDFFVAPGGGVKFGENILEAAVREVREETGLVVEATKPIYLEQFHQPGVQHIKTWVLCEFISGEISTAAPEATREHIVSASFFGQKQLKGISKPLFPDVLANQFWNDLAEGFPEFKYLGNHAMEFY